MSFFDKLFNSAIVSNILSFVSTAGMKILVSVIILVVGFKLVKVIEKKISKGKLADKIDGSVKTRLDAFSESLKNIIV